MPKILSPANGCKGRRAGQQITEEGDELAAHRRLGHVCASPAHVGTSLRVWLHILMEVPARAARVREFSLGE